MSDKFTITLANEAERQARPGQVVKGLERPRELLDRIGASIGYQARTRRHSLAAAGAEHPKAVRR